jgi:hypothetical protein
MIIRQLFTLDRDPRRPLNEVINTEEAIDPRTEIDEYVFTPHTENYLRTLIEGLLDTSQGYIPDCLRGWISGFFGSGKSHFMKLAGALLENRRLVLPDGSDRHALEYAALKHELKLPWERLAKEFRIRTVTVNLAMAHGGGRLAQERPLLHRLASEINRAWGYSSVPHIAAIEREIKKRKKWDNFLEAVRTQTGNTGELDSKGKPYEWMHRDIRDLASEAHRILEVVLPQVLPQYHNAREYLRDKEAEQPSPDAVIQLALDLALSLHADLGRVLLCVDEVALYLRGTGGGFDADRVREIQGLAETVKNKGSGRVFLFATAQLRVDTIDGAFAQLREYVVFLKDRFPPAGRLELEERDIDTVVRERWLKKEGDSAAKSAVEKLIKSHGGLLAGAAKLREESLIRDTAPLTDANALWAYYPCLPFHIRLLQAILEALRGERQVDQTAAQSRALLTTVRALFIPQNGANIAEAEIGSLVTFDKVYDVIRDVVRRADSGSDQWITGTIDSLGMCGTIRVSSAAKVIFLLQHLNPQGQRRVRVSAENVAALLYPRLGEAWEPHLKDVREACWKLLEEHFVGEEPETGYRFYRAEEQTFQKDVARQPVDEGRLRQLLYKSVEDDAKALGLESVPVRGTHRLDVQVAVHGSVQTLPDPQARPTGLALHFVWPRPDGPPVHAKLLAAQYATAAHVAIWVLGSGAEAEDLARRALKLEAGITDYVNRFGQQAATFLKTEQTRLTTLKEELIPHAVRSALISGVTIYRGNDTPISGVGKKPQELFKEMMSLAVSRVYPQLEDGCVQVDEAGLRRVLTWKPPQPLPEFLSSLRVFDDSGQPLLDRPFLKEILLSVQGRPEAKRTGRALLESFAEPPHGWPEKAVKAGFGALLRARRLTVRLTDGSVIRSETDPKAESWLTGTHAFNKSVLELSDLNITPDERKLLAKIFADVFDRPGLDTIEKLEKDGPAVLDVWLTKTRESLADLRGRQLPAADGVEALATVLQAATEPELAVGKLKQLAAVGLRNNGASDSLPILRAHVEIVQATARLRDQNKLGLLADVRSRTTRLYPAWIAEGGGTTVAEHIEGLRAQVVSDDLLRKPQVALDRDRRCFEAYASDYRTRFRRRRERAQQARATIEAHPAWPTVAESLRRELLGGIFALDPVGSGELSIDANPEGRDGTSGATYADLANHLELLDAREHRALQTLSALMSHPANAAAERQRTSSLTMVVSSAEDLPQLYEKIRDLAKAALDRPRRVRVIFEDEDG